MTVVTVSPETDAAANTRHARALAALRSAELRTGVRKQATAVRAVQTVRAEQFGDPPREDLPERPAESLHGSPHESSRVQVRALPGGLEDGVAAGQAAGSMTRPASSSGGRVSAGGPGEDVRVLPVHPHLAALLPDGGLRTGTTVVVRGSTSLLLTLLAEASRDGAWTVLVGYPAAGMAAAADAGCDLARTLVVPLPSGSGVDAPAVLAALIDGMDVVVIGPEVALLDQDRRRLASRARDRDTILVAAQPTPSSSAGSSPLERSSGGRKSSTRREGGWGGAHVVIEVVGGGWVGVDRGAGWLRRRTLRVRRTGRGSAALPLHLDVEVPVCRAAGGVRVVGDVVGAEVVGTVREAGAPGGASESLPRLGLVG